MIRWLLMIVCLGCLAACSTTAPAGESTIFLVNAAPADPVDLSDADLETAGRVALSFLDAWQRQDFDTMYGLLSFSTRDSINRTDFERAYTTQQNIMTMNALSFEPRVMVPAGARAAQLSYDVTFETNILGSFTDANRVMTILRDQTNQWRVAWSTSDILQELRNGARLEFRSSTPSRANIYDRNGVILADNGGVMVEVFVVREDVADWPTCLAALSAALEQPTEQIEAIYAANPASWEVRAGRIEPGAYIEHEARLSDVCGATFPAMPTRQYLPNGSVMPHILGHVSYPTAEQMDEVIRTGFNAETMIGQAGIERTWNETLMGQPGGRLTIVGADGRVVRVLAEVDSEPADSLWLTIEHELQQYVTRSIAEAYANSGPNGWGSTSPGAAGVVMEVNTGEILALVSYPSYDANAYTTFPAVSREIAEEIKARVANDPRVPQLNRPLQGTYSAGSTFKVIDSMALLDTGLYNVNTSYVCGGIWNYEGDVRYDWLAGGHGGLTTRTAIRQSCNPFFYQAGFVLNQRDPYLLPEYARRMGLGVPTGLQDLPEAIGLIPDPEFIRVTRAYPWSYADAVNLAIGQGEMSVTPLQMTRMYAAIANGGTLYRPQLVRERGILDERTFVATPDAMSEFGFSQVAIETVQQGLCDVTSTRNGTAWHIFNLPTESPTLELGVCGKTGTAQTPQPQSHSWFVAYAPAQNPEIVTLVMVENSGEGSAIAAPIVERILEYYFFLRNDAD